MTTHVPQVLSQVLEQTGVRAQWIEQPGLFAKIEGEFVGPFGIWYLRPDDSECTLYAFSDHYFPGTGTDSERFNLAIELLKANFLSGAGRIGIVEHGDQKILGIVCQTAFFLREHCDREHVDEFKKRIESLQRMLATVEAVLKASRS